MNKINVADYGVDVSDFLATGSVKPYFQWFNPSSKNYGFAIDKKIASSIDFKPDENWKLEQVKLKDEDKKAIMGEMWFSRTPRMILLNGYPYAKISNENKVDSTALLMFNKETKKVESFNQDKYKESKTQYDLFFILVALFVDKDNNLLSDTPLIFRTKGKAKILFKEKYKEFIDESLKNFQAILNTTLPKQTPTCKFLSRFVFTPKLEQGDVTGSNGMSSPATVVTGYETITEDNFTSLVLPKDHPTFQYALSILPSLESYIHPSIDTNTGEVHLTPEELEQLKDYNIEF